MTELVPITVDAEIVDDDDDLFTPVGGSVRTQYGLNPAETRYLFPPPPGQPYRKAGYRRMTKLVAAFSDQERLSLWLEWKAFMGMRVNDGLLFDEWMAEPAERMELEQQRDLANRYAAKAREAAGADSAARRGTARHQMMDTFLTKGEVTGTRSMRAQLASAMEALDRCGFEVVQSETRIWHPACDGTVGTLDVLVSCRRTGQVGILDWKTQARFWTWQEISGQLFGYDSAPWTWEGPADASGGWVESIPRTLLGHPDGLFPGRRVALVAHMPQQPGPGQLPVEIHEVDMTYGRRVLEVAAENIGLRSVGRSVAVGRRPSGIRPPQG